MAEMSKVEFAAHIGRSPSYVTKLLAQGRLVMSADGKRVDVEASKRLIEQTGGERQDVSDRWKAARKAKKEPTQGAGTNEAEKTPQRPTAQAEAAEKIGSSYQAARAVKEKYAALRVKAEYETLIGDLIPKEDVDAALRFIGAAIRSEMEVFPDQATPLVAPTTNLAEIHEILATACADVLKRVSEELNRRRAACVAQTA